MRYRIGLLGGIAALVAAAGIGWNTPASAQQQTLITKFSGTSTVSGIWTRTITDITEPNGPNDPWIAAFPDTYVISVPYSIGATASQLASAYRDSARARLPLPPGNPHGYGVVQENSKAPSIRVSKQKGTFNYIDSTVPTGSEIVSTFQPFNAEHAPAASPAALAALVASLAGLAWWTRRRRASA